MNEYDLSQVLDFYLNLKSVFEFYGYGLNRGGFCRCPFHMEDTPSCKVNSTTFHCFGCDEKGNAISFVRKLFNLSFKNAVRKLNADFNLRLLASELTPKQSAEMKKRQIDIYEKKQKKLDFERTKEEYFEAWKYYVLFKPKDVNYDINTPEFLVNSWFDSVDKRWWEAIKKLNLLSVAADIGNYKIDEDEARWMFLKE